MQRRVFFVKLASICMKGSQGALALISLAFSTAENWKPFSNVGWTDLLLQIRHTSTVVNVSPLEVEKNHRPRSYVLLGVDWVSLS